MITAIHQDRGDMPSGPDAVSVALEASVPNDRATALIRASWHLVEQFTGKNYWPVISATARAQVDAEGDIYWPRNPYPSALTVERWESNDWQEVAAQYLLDFGLIADLLPGRYRIKQTEAINPDPPAEHVTEAVRALALYQLIHSPARREFRLMSASESSLTREALDSLFRASGAGILLAGERKW